MGIPFDSVRSASALETDESLDNLPRDGVACDAQIDPKRDGQRPSRRTGPAKATIALQASIDRAAPHLNRSRSQGKLLIKL
jgi:hypothetical protein